MRVFQSQLRVSFTRRLRRPIPLFNGRTAAEHSPCQQAGNLEFVDLRLYARRDADLA